MAMRNPIRLAPPLGLLVVGLLVGSLLAVAGCGSEGDDVASGDGDTPVSGPATTATSPDGGTATTAAITWARIEPTDDLEAPVLTEPVELVADPGDDQVVLVHFYGGVPECYGARAEVVREDERQVEIRLETGTRPGTGDRACIEIAEAQELAVTLAAPVADRRLEATPST